MTYKEQKEIIKFIENNNHLNLSSIIQNILIKYKPSEDTEGQVICGQCQEEFTLKWHPVFTARASIEEVATCPHCLASYGNTILRSVDDLEEVE